MKKVDIYAIRGKTKRDDAVMMKMNKANIKMTIDEYGRIFNEGGQYIADAAEVEPGFGIGCNQHGGKREGAGRKPTGRKKQTIYVTDDELIKVREYIDRLRD